jgi:hypothetical protein
MSRYPGWHINSVVPKGSSRKNFEAIHCQQTLEMNSRKMLGLNKAKDLNTTGCLFGKKARKIFFKSAMLIIMVKILKMLKRQSYLFYVKIYRQTGRYFGDRRKDMKVVIPVEVVRVMPALQTEI